MSVDAKDLEAKLREMYPEIEQHNLKMDLNFNEDKDAWIVKFSRGEHELTTHLERKDAEDCLKGIECVYLGVQIEQFIKNFEVA